MAPVCVAHTTPVLIRTHLTKLLPVDSFPALEGGTEQA